MKALIHVLRAKAVVRSGDVSRTGSIYI